MGKSLIPLPKKAQKILVAESRADTLGYQCGGWIITEVSRLKRRHSLYPGQALLATCAGQSNAWWSSSQASPSSSSPISRRQEPYVPKADALVAAWLPGTEGQGFADLLFGDYGFTSKLARTWFRSADQLPMNVGGPALGPALSVWVWPGDQRHQGR
ncbi:hypothetical protein NL676_004608 [Syzygium grande]|nr:hypothetical protein NL676_004608 [Syzygium grande]